MKSLNWMQKGGSLFFEREAEDIFNVTRKFSCILHSSGTLSSIEPGKGREGISSCLDRRLETPFVSLFTRCHKS